MLSQGKQNHLEYYSSLLLKQHIFDNASLFIVGIANGYDGALSLIERIAEEAYEKTGEVNLRKFLLDRQEEFEKKGDSKRMIHILFLILKIIGWILLFFARNLLLLILTILFYPVRYRFSAKGEEYT